MVQESVQAERNKNTPQTYDYDVYHPSNDNNQNEGSHFWHQNTPEQLRPIPPQPSGISSLVPGAICTGAFLMIFALLARCIGARSSDIRLTNNNGPRGSY